MGAVEHHEKAYHQAMRSSNHALASVHQDAMERHIGMAKLHHAAHAAGHATMKQTMPELSKAHGAGEMSHSQHMAQAKIHAKRAFSKGSLNSGNMHQHKFHMGMYHAHRMIAHLSKYLSSGSTNNRMSNQLVSTPPPRQSDPPSEQFMRVDSSNSPNPPNYPNAGRGMEEDAPAGSGLGNAHDPKELKKGVKDEMKEHDMSKAKATKTAKQHLSRVDEHYYTKTEKAMKNCDTKCEKHGIMNCNSCGCGMPDKKHIHEPSAKATLPKMANNGDSAGRENDGDKNIQGARAMFAGGDPDKDGDVHNCMGNKKCKAHGIDGCNICNEAADGEMSDPQSMGNSRIGDLSSSPMIGGKKPVANCMPNKVLTAKARQHISKKNFALPGGRYPIHDKAHARNALARVSQYGTSSEKAKVRAAVSKKYPNIGNREMDEQAEREAVIDTVQEKYPELSNRACELAADILMRKDNR
jgi:hypothetical protein